jgi:hypothetical protein
MPTKQKCWPKCKPREMTARLEAKADANQAEMKAMQAKMDTNQMWLEAI